MLDVTERKLEMVDSLLSQVQGLRQVRQAHVHSFALNRHLNYFGKLDPISAFKTIVVPPQTTYGRRPVQCEQECWLGGIFSFTHSLHLHSLTRDVQTNPRDGKIAKNISQQ